MALRQAASVPPYCTDMQKKHQWTRGDFEKVHWTLIDTALASFPPEDQRWIILFIHDKLPLRASKAHPHHGSQLCPSCQREPKDAGHLLECNHPERNQLFTSLKRQLTAYTQKIRLHPCIFTALWLGLAATRTKTAYPDILEEIPQPIQPPIQHQTKLGWWQLNHGRVTQEWAKAIDATHPNLAATGEHVMLHIVKLLWNYFLNVWKLCNQHLHNTAATLNLPNYKQAAETLYEQRHQLSTRAQAALFRQPLQYVLELPPPRLQTWVIRGYKYFTQQLKAEQRQATLATPDIRHYFQPLAQQTDDLHPP